MIERPMRQVSLRKFRDDIALLREVVEVSRRDNDGHIHVLGYWTPYKQPEPEVEIRTHPSTMSAAALDAGADSEEIRRPVLDIPVDPDDATTYKVISTAEEAAAAVATIPASGTPYPKDVQAGRKKRR